MSFYANMIQQLQQPGNIMIIAVLGSLFGGAYAYKMYQKKKDDSDEFEGRDIKNIWADEFVDDTERYGRSTGVKLLKDRSVVGMVLTVKNIRSTGRVKNFVSNHGYKDLLKDIDLEGKKVSVLKMREDGFAGRLAYILGSKLKLHKIGLDKGHWYAVVPEEWIQYSDNSLALYKDAQFKRIREDVDVAMHMNVWDVLFGIHSWEMLVSIVKAQGNYAEKINALVPQHTMDKEMEELAQYGELSKKIKNIVDDAQG